MVTMGLARRTTRVGVVRVGLTINDGQIRVGGVSEKGCSDYQSKEKSED